MARRWQTNNRDRTSKKYIALHEQLKSELQYLPLEPSKAERHRMRSEEHRRGMA